MIDHTDRLQSFHKNLVNKDTIGMIQQDLFKERFEMISPPLMKSLLTTKISFSDFSRNDSSSGFWKIRTFLPPKS